MFNEIIKTSNAIDRINTHGFATIMFIDFELQTGTTNSSIATISPKVFEQKFDKKDIKSTDYLNLYDIIINKYYELSLKNYDHIIEKLTNIDDIEIDLDSGLSTIDNRKILSKFNSLSNYIASETRIGPANVAIIPDKKYEIFFPHHDIKTIVNPTNTHKDKIFILRVNKKLDQPGLLLLLLDDNLQTMRYYKIQKLLNKNINFKVNYILTETGLNCEKYVMCINL